MSGPLLTSPGARRGRVCFHSEFAYPLFTERTAEFAGGAESQVVQLARGLVSADYEVSMVTCDFGQPPVQVIDGVTILRSFRPGQGVRGFRFFHPRLSRSAAALLRANADIYYVCGSGMTAGLTHDVARWRGVPFVLAMMTDYDVIRRPPPKSGATHRAWFRRALRGADRVLAQTEFQKSQLRDNFGIASEVLPNIVVLPEPAVDPAQDGIVLWTATYKPIKRPEWFLELARALPQHRFVMTGVVPPPPLSRESWDRARETARTLGNLEVLGFQPQAELAALRRRAALVVHTSPMEGFSNVLLESWAAGLPTVSGVDPDGLVTRERIGRFAPDFATLVEAVQGYMSDPSARREAGRRARLYALRAHSPDVVLGTLRGMLDPLLGARRGPRS